MQDIQITAYPLEGDKDVGLFCVFDGHGGKECAEEIAEEFPKNFSYCFSQKNGYSKKDLKDIWLNAYKETEDYLKDSKEYDFQGYYAY